MSNTLSTTKKCTKCKQVKDRDKFYSQGMGVSGMCKPCFSAYQNAINREKRAISKEL